jgi:predicted metal-binding membrane protein
VTPATAIEALARRDRIVVAAGLAGIAALSWLYLFHRGAAMGDMAGMQGMAMPALEPWSAADALMMFVMWAVMMAAMMIPSAAPMILLHAAILRKRNDGQPSGGATCAFAAGYLAVWIGFSALATGTQWGLEQAALLSPMMASTSPYLGAALLIAAGLYQMTNLKEVCLKHCRSPIHFISDHWRKGTGGAFRMGLDHGVYCVGCCWVLMALLFVGGVMNLLWIAALSAFVLVEKLAPRGLLAGRIGGGLMILVGLWLLIPH